MPRGTRGCRAMAACRRRSREVSSPKSTHRVTSHAKSLSKGPDCVSPSIRLVSCMSVVLPTGTSARQKGLGSQTSAHSGAATDTGRFTLGDAPIAVATNCTILGRWQTEIAPAVPALFTFPSDAPFGSNLRIAAAVNEDGTVNSWAHPAKSGSVVALYATGLGALTNDMPLRRLREHVEAYGLGASGGGSGMEILYAGTRAKLRP